MSHMKKIISLLLILAMCFGMFLMTGCEKTPAMDDGWKSDVLASYNEFIQEVTGNENRIPIIVTTDQHGSVSKDSEIYSYINEIVDWGKISKIINLGDTVKRLGNKKDLNDYVAATECLPEDKRVELMGNHDRLYLGNREKLKKTYFSTKNAVVNDENNAFAVYDVAYNVRYVSVDPEQFPWTYKNGRLSTSQADFIVAELEKSDASDIIFVSHPYLFKDDMITRDGEHFTGSDYFIGSDKKYTDVKDSFVKMLSARKAKTSGVLIDCSGVEHPYDFTKCQGDFLMALHGHHHQEGYETKDGVAEFLFQSLVYDNKDDTEPNCVYFAYIDRVESVFKCWKVVEGKRYDAWEISIGDPSPQSDPSTQSDPQIDPQKKATFPELYKFVEEFHNGTVAYGDIYSREMDELIPKDLTIDMFTFEMVEYSEDFEIPAMVNMLPKDHGDWEYLVPREEAKAENIVFTNQETGDKLTFVWDSNAVILETKENTYYAIAKFASELYPQHLYKNVAYYITRFDGWDTIYDMDSEILIADVGQSVEEVAQEFTEQYYALYDNLLPIDRAYMSNIEVTTHVLDKDEAPQIYALKEYKGKILFSSGVTFTPGIYLSMGGNTGHYDGDPDMLWREMRVCYLEKTADGYRGKIMGTGW